MCDHNGFHKPCGNDSLQVLDFHDDVSLFQSFHCLKPQGPTFASFWFMVIYQNMSCHQPIFCYIAKLNLAFLTIIGPSQDVDSCIVSFKKKQLLLRFLAGFTLQSDNRKLNLIGANLYFLYFFQHLPGSSWPNPGDITPSPPGVSLRKDLNETNQTGSPGVSAVENRQEVMSPLTCINSNFENWWSCGTVFFFS